jgi:hypothetical protein
VLLEIDDQSARSYVCGYKPRLTRSRFRLVLLLFSRLINIFHIQYAYIYTRVCMCMWWAYGPSVNDAAIQQSDRGQAYTYNTMVVYACYIIQQKYKFADEQYPDSITL